MRRIPALALSVAAFAIAGCDADEPHIAPDRVGPSTTTTAATSPSVEEPVPSSEASVACDAMGGSSSRADFDPASGTYAAIALEMRGRSLRFDVVQWLVGTDAEKAYQEDEPGSGPPPNDYWVRNRSAEQRTAIVDEAARVELVRLDQDADAASGPGTVDELPGYIRDHPGTIYWLRFEGGIIKRVCEQYQP